MEIERRIIYRSDFLLRLFDAIEAGFRNFPRGASEVNLEMQVRIKQDEDIIGLFCLILHKRMFIIDDLEFVGQRQSLK